MPTASSQWTPMLGMRPKHFGHPEVLVGMSHRDAGRFGDAGDVDLEFIEACSQRGGHGASASASGRQRSRAATWCPSTSCSVMRSVRSSPEATSRATAAIKASQETSVGFVGGSDRLD